MEKEWMDGGMEGWQLRWISHEIKTLSDGGVLRMRMLQPDEGSCSVLALKQTLLSVRLHSSFKNMIQNMFLILKWKMKLFLLL